MSDFLTRMAERALGAKAVVRPDISPYFAPVSSGAAVDEPTRLPPEQTREAQGTPSTAHALAPGVTPVAQTQVALPAPVAAAAILHDSADRMPRPPRVAPAFASVQHAALRRGQVATSQPEVRDTAANNEPSQSPRLASHPPLQVVAPVRPEPAMMPELWRPEPSRRIGSAAATVQVSIGRVEVRAIMPAPTPVQRVAKETPSAALSLDDYLRARNRGGR